MEIRLPRPRLPQNLPQKKVLIPAILVIVIVLGIVLTITWPFKQYAGLKMSPKWDIVDNIMSEPSDSYFAHYLYNMEYNTFLRNEGPFTVFVPLNSGYANLSGDMQDYLNDKDNPGALRQVLLFHVVKGDYRYAELKDGMTLKTLQGEKLTVQKKGDSLIINGYSYVQTYDIVSKNGVIHLVNNFLVPPTIAE